MPKSDPETPKPLTASAAAKRLGVHPETVVAWADAGKLSYWRTPGGHRRFNPVDVDELMQPEDPQVAAS